MQNYIMYAVAGSTLGAIRDYANSKAFPAPVFTRGFSATIKLRLFIENDNTSPYPINQLSNITSWQCVWDTDYSQTSIPKIVADNSSIFVQQVDEIINETEYHFTEIVIPVSNMNTQELADAIGNSEAISNLNMEIVGFDANSKEVFGLQIKGFTARNRIYYGGTPTIIEPDYLTASQVRSLIGAGVDIQFSNDNINWHTCQANDDVYFRVRSASDASSMWSAGIALPMGVNTYNYVAYASDNAGSDFSLTPSDTLPFRAEIRTYTAIEQPTVNDFASAVWVKYIGDDGTNGANGINGVNGTAATISIGTVTTGAPGTNASVTNSGTATDAVLNFTIPKGADGDSASGSMIGYAIPKALGPASPGLSTNASAQDHVHPTTGLVLSSEKGVANGIASLNAYGKVPSAQLDLSMYSTTEGIMSSIAELKGAPNGFASLDSNGKLLSSQMPYGNYIEVVSSLPNASGDTVDKYYMLASNDKIYKGQAIVNENTITFNTGVNGFIYTFTTDDDTKTGIQRTWRQYFGMYDYVILSYNTDGGYWFFADASNFDWAIKSSVTTSDPWDSSVTWYKKFIGQEDYSLLNATVTCAATYSFKDLIAQWLS